MTEKLLDLFKNVKNVITNFKPFKRTVYVAFSKESRDSEITLGVFLTKEKAVDAICKRVRENILPSEGSYTNKEIEEIVEKVKRDLYVPCYCLYDEASLHLTNGHHFYFTVKDLRIGDYIFGNY